MKIAGEFGDLLLQIVFHAELGREADRFDISDVIERIHTKMVRRHPHVFGDVKARTAGEVLKKWEEVKAEERLEAKGVPRLRTGVRSRWRFGRASRVGGGASDILRAANVGLIGLPPTGILEKIEEEVAELRETLQDADSSRREEEIGDLLFAAVNLARFLDLDPEIALKRANRKFKERFRAMERDAAASGRPSRRSQRRGVGRAMESGEKSIDSDTTRAQGGEMIA